MDQIVQLILEKRFFLEENRFHMSFDELSMVIPFYLIKKYQPKFSCSGFNTWHISRNSTTTYDTIKQNPDVSWNFRAFSRNRNLSFDIVLNNLHHDWNWDALTYHPNITFDMIRDNPDKPWNLGYISKNPNLTIDIIKENPSVYWDYVTLCNHANITYDDIVNNSHLPWTIKNFVSNPNITIEYMNKIKSEYEDYSPIINSTSKYITPDIISDPENEWIWKHIKFQSYSENSNVTIDMVIKYPLWPWNWTVLSYNRNMTFEIINKYPKFNWSLGHMCLNESIIHVSSSEIESYLRKYFAIQKIKRYWLKAYYCPDFQICKKRILGEYNNLILKSSEDL